MHNEIYKKCFPGVNANHLNHPIIPKLSEDKLNTVIIHVGVNDIMNGTVRDDLILQTGRTGFTCKKYGVKNIISGLVFSRRIKNDIIDYVNHQNYKFINNSNIPVEHLCKDGLPRDLNGKSVLFENYFNFLGHLSCPVHST